MAKAIAHFISTQQPKQWIEAEVEEDDVLSSNFKMEDEGGNGGYMNWEDF